MARPDRVTPVSYTHLAINHDMSVSSIIDPMTKIKHLLDNHGIPIGNQE